MSKIEIIKGKYLRPIVTSLFILTVTFLFNACTSVSDRPIVVFTPHKLVVQEVIAMETKSAERKIENLQ